MGLIIQVLDGLSAVCRLPAGSALPSWFVAGALSHVSWTEQELSIVCDESMIPQDVQCERGWRSLMLCGPFAFNLTGILVQVLQPLADAEIGIFAVSTFDTDYVMIKQEHLDNALHVLRAAGHTIQK